MNDPERFEESESYREGFRAGRLDRLYLGLCLSVALASTWGYYGQGYRDGQLAGEREAQS